MPLTVTRMLKFVGMRVLQAVPVLLGITVASFFLIHLVPGDPARIQLGPHATVAAGAALKRQLGLDRSLLRSIVRFCRGPVSLRFGESLGLHQSGRGLDQIACWYHGVACGLQFDG